MPELPDVAVFKQYLDSTSLHRPIDHVEVTDDGILEDVTPRTLKKRLRGRALVSTRQHGKHLFVETDGDRWLVLHFGMTGFLKSFARQDARPTHARVLLHFTDGSILAYVSQRKVGSVGLAETPESAIEARELGPDPLHSDFDLRDFRDLVRGRSGSVKSFLMNQQAMAGVGNVYSDETLFEAGLHPATRVAALDDEGVENLYRSMEKVLKKAIERRVDVERFPPRSLLPHREDGEACPRCPGTIVKETIAGRSSYYCDRHQRRAG